MQITLNDILKLTLVWTAIEIHADMPEDTVVMTIPKGQTLYDASTKYGNERVTYIKPQGDTLIICIDLEILE